MARASRSSKKQPDFDPSELEDLIFSPAVGKGVGSHLVNQPPLTTVVTSEVSTEAISTTVARKDTSHESREDLTTIVTSDRLSVVTLDLTTVDEQTVPVPSPAPLWITEHGDLVSQARVKRIRLAQDVINSAEECVYDTLWNARLLDTDERESCRLVQAGYDYLVKRTRLSRKTIQRIVAKLLEKDFITVETRADIYQRTATVYRVFSYKAVLERHLRRDRLYVAKMGPGFSYARPLNPPVAKERREPDLATVVWSKESTVVRTDMPPVVNRATVTMAKNDRPTVVKMSPHLLDSSALDRRTSSSAPVREALASYGTVDDDVALQLMAACRSYASDCTESEVIHFVHEKGQHIQKRDSRVHSPIGFLLTAVPKCFSGDALQSYREEQGRERRGPSPQSAGEDPALLRWRREQEAALSDPAVSEQEKHLIRLCLGFNAG